MHVYYIIHYLLGKNVVASIMSFNSLKCDCLSELEFETKKSTGLNKEKQKFVLYK